MALTRDTVKDIRSDVEAALRQIAQKHNIDFNLGRITFSNTSVSCKVSGVVRVTGVAGVQAVAPSADMNNLLMYLKRTGKQVDLTKTYHFANLGLCNVIGYVPRRPKYPIIVQTVVGNKRFKVSEFSFNLATK